jgi:precorrin-6A/cobalt-precorrin-6A reductase
MTHLLVLSGTGEARQLLASLAADPLVRVTASLAGATPRPAPLGVETRIGGFGGIEGLAEWCDAHDVDAIIDMTHPYAAAMSHHAAALSARLPVIAYHRPAWQAQAGECWVEFDSWDAMATELPRDARPFLAGGSRAITAFVKRADLPLLGRGLKFDDELSSINNLNILNALPSKKVEDEVALLTAHNISHICAKNSGGNWSYAKIAAARALGLPVWFLARPALPQGHQHYQICDNLDAVSEAINAIK